MAQHRISSGMLIRPKFTTECRLETAAAVALIANGHSNAQVIQHAPNLVETATREADVTRMIVGARDDARLAVRG
jgi:hypothetical protein